MTPVMSRSTTLELGLLGKQATLEQGQRLETVLKDAAASMGEVVDFALTLKAGYAAVRNEHGQVEAVIIPYKTDFRAPGARPVSFSIQSERDNPQYAAAPMSLVEGLSPARGENDAAWRQQCFINEALRRNTATMLAIGDCVITSQVLQSNQGPLKPDFYVLKGHDLGFSVLESLRTGRAALVKNAAADMTKITLTNDLESRLSNHPRVTSFGIQRCARNDDHEHHILIGRTPSDNLVPLAKAVGKDELDFMTSRMWEVAKTKQESLRSLEQSPIYKYMRDNNLTEAVMEQARGIEPQILSDLVIEVTAPQSEQEYTVESNGPSI
ncbi:Uncharacterised protein [Pseudomonas luteola]|uniref:Uncharacterized protein n=3 Tax=Pseudomonas TaxID=286 RepID=A0A2X2EE62_PSELU|nr:hypothetical protein SAMN05216409_11479 [Pseudomonas lutea]SPZ04960.1 Uncharacterised protein [Pseudomonas luteola]